MIDKCDKSALLVLRKEEWWLATEQFLAVGRGWLG